MKMTLHNLTIENFKGIKQFKTDFGGIDARVLAANGVGKTTLYDAYLWLLFGKDSTGRKDFEVRPLDASNEKIKGLVVAAEATVLIDSRPQSNAFFGKGVTFRKEEHERFARDQVVGYTAKYWIDEVPMKQREYEDYVHTIIPEETFKLLTDLSCFQAKWHWTDRRKTLLAMAGKTGTPIGFEELIKAAKGKSIDDYKTVLTEQKKAHTKERAEIGPRIDELQRSVADYVQGDSEADLTKKRDAVNETIVDIVQVRTDVLKAEQKREDAREKLNKLRGKKAEREGFLAGDTSGTQKLRDEAEELRKHDTELRTKLNAVLAEGSETGNLITHFQSAISALMLRRADIRKEYEQADSDLCSQCEQIWPADKEKPGLSDIKERGEAVHSELNAKQDKLTQLQVDFTATTKNRHAAEAELLASQETTAKRIAEIDAEIKNYQGTKPIDDDDWCAICTSIEMEEEAIGPPVADQLEEIEGRKRGAEAMRDKINEALAQADNAKKAKARIAELEAKEQDLSQKLADIEKQLSRIESYKMCESELIAEAVNCKFQHVTFKMFEEQLNGGLKECCEATYQGVPYKDMSTGQQIICGVDIINALSEHYGVSVPLFVDHAESLTLPLGAKSQTIRLYAAENVTELQVELEESGVEAA